ncbi:MAG TPA: protein kinase [Polyangiaceae bacterium]|nr:protein kinase [Polyangiaceae bacterium]
MNGGELPSVGDTLSGKYRLTRKLGQGGMGAVYEATHLRLGQKVAIKVVLPEVAERPELAYRFEHEARAAAKLRGRHAVRVLDVDTSPEGLPFLVMELLEGHSLRDELARRGPLPIEDAVRYVREACEGVDEAHRAGIVHRDIKPANLFLSAEGEGVAVVKVVDFGIAKANDVGGSDYHTATNAPLGTYKYMSPEQARSARSVDARTDVWSLGVVLYQLLSGKTPFNGEGALGVVYAIATQAPPPLRASRPDVPEALVAVVERALSKELEGRYQTVRELSDALAPFDTARLSLPPRSPSFSMLTPAGGASRRPSAPALTPGGGLPRPATSSGPPATPASGVTPPATLSDLGHAPTQPHPPPAPADVGTTLGEPTRRGLRPPATAGDGVPNESVTSGSKSHVVPIKSKGPVAGPSAMPLWLLGALLTLAGGVTMGVRAARMRSDATTLTSASPPVAAPSRDLSARSTPTTPPAPATAVGARPPQIVPVDAPASRPPEPSPGADAAGTAAPPGGPSASAAHASARPRTTKAPPGKATGGQTSREAPPAPAKASEPKPPDREIFD